MILRVRSNLLSISVSAFLMVLSVRPLLSLVVGLHLMFGCQIAISFRVHILFHVVRVPLSLVLLRLIVKGAL